MKVEFDPDDIRPEFKDKIISSRDVTFSKLSDQAQAVLRIVKRGVFYTWDRMTYNAVFVPPKRKKKS